MEGNNRNARIRQNLLSDSERIEVNPSNINSIMSFRKSVGDHYVKTVYTGFLALMSIEFNFESREDISNMSTIFSEHASEILGSSDKKEYQNTTTGATRFEDLPTNKRTALTKISKKMSRKRINGSWKISTVAIGSLQLYLEIMRHFWII